MGDAGGGRWLRRWVITAAGAGVLATAADAVLLQRDRAYFTGGFLAADYLTSAAQTVGFLATSLLADWAVFGLFAGLALWTAARLGVRARVAMAVAVVLALLPFAIDTFVSYELASYLGDALNLGLLFNLAGRNVSELVAVSSQHLVTALWAGAGLVVVVALGVVLVRRRRHASDWSGLPPFWRAMRAPLALLLAATVLSSAVRANSDTLDNGLRRKPAGQWLGLLVNRLTDVDRDGYGLLGRPGDPALFDSRVHPYAIDLPGDGIDQDGVAGDLPAALGRYEEPDSTPVHWTSRRDVVLVVLESFRADAVGATVGGKAVTPVLDALARGGLSIAHAYSHNGYTVQARNHIFTGSIAGVRGGTTIVDDFKANGYETAYFSGQDDSFGGAANSTAFAHADVAFDARSAAAERYSSFSTAGSLAVPYTVVLNRVQAFLAHRDANRPLFLYVNFHDTHFPYHHAQIAPLVSNRVLAQRDITEDHAAELRETYLNTAANVDRAIGQLLESVGGALGRQPGVVVLSDHGESLFDEGFLGHGYALNEAQTRIPLVVANLPAVVPDLMAQSEVRDVLRHALERDTAAPATPVVERTPRTVFQYLGTIDRPAQIGFRTAGGQVLFDFRSGRARIDGGRWLAPETLNAADAVRWRELVTTWERMLVSRRGESPRG